MTADDFIETLGLEAHVEGGYFKEVYRSTLSFSPEPVSGWQGEASGVFSGNRSLCTSIYFLLKSRQFSAFHRLKADEIWFFHWGSSLRVHQIDEFGVYSTEILGGDIHHGEVPQVLFRAGVYFAAEPVNQDSFSLVSCVVSPGFDYRDFELPGRAELSQKFPQHIPIIDRFVRG